MIETSPSGELLRNSLSMLIMNKSKLKLSVIPNNGLQHSKILIISNTIDTLALELITLEVSFISLVRLKNY